MSVHAENGMVHELNTQMRMALAPYNELNTQLWMALSLYNEIECSGRRTYLPQKSGSLVRVTDSNGSDL